MRRQSQDCRESGSRMRNSQRVRIPSGKENDQGNNRKSLYNPMASPLKPALDLAVSKVVTGLNSSRVNVSSVQPATERSRVTYCNTERTPNRRKKLAYSRVDNKSPLNGRMHPETQAFLRSHFGDSDAIPIDQFVEVYLQEHSELWAEKGDIADQLFEALKETLGDGEYLDVGKLAHLTRVNGPIGIIMEVCKRLQADEGEEEAPQVTNLKNIIQEFMESMYKKLENQLYTKFNAEMRRMVLRAKDAEKLLKDCNDQITSHYDVFSKKEHRELGRLTKELARQRETSHKLKEQLSIVTDERNQFERENERLTQTINKCHQHVFKESEKQKAIQLQSEKQAAAKDQDVHRQAERLARQLFAQKESELQRTIAFQSERLCNQMFETKKKEWEAEINSLRQQLKQKNANPYFTPSYAPPPSASSSSFSSSSIGYTPAGMSNYHSSYSPYNYSQPPISSTSFQPTSSIKTQFSKPPSLSPSFTTYSEYSNSLYSKVKEPSNEWSGDSIFDKVASCAGKSCDKGSSNACPNCLKPQNEGSYRLAYETSIKYQ